MGERYLKIKEGGRYACDRVAEDLSLWLLLSIGLAFQGLKCSVVQCSVFSVHQCSALAMGFGGSFLLTERRQ